MGETKDKASILLGDFNEILSNDEKEGRATRSEGSFLLFKNFIAACGLQEIPYQGNALSWFGNRCGHLVHCKLDRVLANSEFLHQNPGSQSIYLSRIGSDHSPIFTSLDGEGPRKRGTFRFDLRWVKKEGFREAVVRGWTSTDESDEDNLVQKIMNCRREIALWKKSAQVNSRQTIIFLKKRIDHLNHQPHLDLSEYREAKHQLYQAYRDEEDFWKQKSRLTWMKSGDKNTRFFHASTKQRKNWIKILSLTDEYTSQQVFSEDHLGQLAIRSFSNLYRSELQNSERVHLSSLFNNFPRNITAEHNSILLQEVTEEEVRKAVFEMGAEKAPGPDGFTGLFYQEFWDITKKDLTNLVQNFFSSGILDSRLCDTHICLIPKKKLAPSLKDYRPISLCNYAYKIIANVLSSGLKMVLPLIILENHTAFIKGRLISDNILVAHEMMHALRTKGAVTKEQMAIKTDMAKDFDRLEWSFIEEVMKRMDFDDKWIQLIMTCITSVTFFVLINGQPTIPFSPSRGIKQGDIPIYLHYVCRGVGKWLQEC